MRAWILAAIVMPELVEPGESIRQALERELREEGNIELTDKPLFHGLYFNRHVSDRDHVALFIVRAFRQSAPPQPGHCRHPRVVPT